MNISLHIHKIKKSSDKKEATKLVAKYFQLILKFSFYSSHKIIHRETIAKGGNSYNCYYKLLNLAHKSARQLLIHGFWLMW